MDVPRTKQAGWIEVITGSMFSGKSEELIRRLRRAQIARQKVQIFKPTFDNRYSDDHIVSHSDMRIASAQRRELDGAARRGRRRHRGRRHRRGAVLRRRPAGRLQRAGEPRQARDRGRPRPGLPRQAVRADAAAAGHRRVHHQDAGHLHGVRQPGEPHAAPRREPGPRPARRAGDLRGPLPPLLRPGARLGARAAA